MKFAPVEIDQAIGKILGHNIFERNGRRALRKGKPLTVSDIALLQEMGRKTVYVAELEEGDVGEDVAARLIAAAGQGKNVRSSGGVTGRVNLYAEQLGVVRIDIARLAWLNGLAGVSWATLRQDVAVNAGTLLSTLKIIPYALPQSIVHQAQKLAGYPSPLLSLDPLLPRKVSLILSGSPSTQERVTHSFETALRSRLAALGSLLATVTFVPLEDEADEQQLAQTIRQQLAQQHQLIILAGETAIMDRYDIAPRAVERAGGEITCFGAPVDPGNLLMLAYHQAIPILGAPGCARSPKANIIDLILPRLLVGDRLTQSDIINFGHGGLLEEIPERPLPRTSLEHSLETR